MSRTHIVDSCDEDQTELLITYNNITVIFDLTTEPPSQMKLFWNTTPSAVVYIFPFLLAFTCDTIEIRLAINGSLVATLFMPHLKLITSKNDIFFSASAVQVTTPASAKLGPDTTSVFSHLYNSAKGAGSPHESPQDLEYKLYRIPLAQLLGLNPPSGSHHAGISGAPPIGTIPPDVSARIEASSTTNLQPISGNHTRLAQQRSNPTNTLHSTGMVNDEQRNANNTKLSPSTAYHRKLFNQQQNALQKVENVVTSEGTSLKPHGALRPVGSANSALNPQQRVILNPIGLPHHGMACKTTSSSTKSDSGLSSQGSLECPPGPQNHHPVIAGRSITRPHLGGNSDVTVEMF